MSGLNHEALERIVEKSIDDPRHRMRLVTALRYAVMRYEATALETKPRTSQVRQELAELREKIVWVGNTPLFRGR